LSEYRAEFGVGEVIRHRRFDYRGVVFDVDATFQGSDEWYEQVARSRPPKDKPWYHVLVHGAEHTTYVAERHLELDEGGQRIQHPLLAEFFAKFEDGRYRSANTVN
jgi:heat shock protein HspQ